MDDDNDAPKNTAPTNGETDVDLENRGVKQAFAWRVATELVRRHPNFHISEQHEGGGQYDELVVSQWKPGEPWRSVVRFNYEGRMHVAPFEDGYVAWNWVQALNMDQYELLRRVEDHCGIAHPDRLPSTTGGALTYRVISALTAAHALDRHVPSLRRANCYS